MTRTLAEFYNGKTIFLTGAAGYVGSILLEILLRCFPGIKCVYILLRSKKGMGPHERKKQIMESVVMKYIKQNSPEVMEKVHVLAGDIAEPHLGMSDEDTQKIINEVQIVFHCASLVSFTNSFRAESINNGKGLFLMLNLCKKIKNLQALIYTGTAFANIHAHPEKLKEEIYEFKYPSQRFLDELDNGTDESFEDLVASMGFKYPNSYIFSKRLAENIIKDFSEDLPIVIVRPSIVIPPWKGPYKGYFPSGLGFPNIAYAIVRGITRVLPFYNNNSTDIVPADIVANTHIIAAWGISTGRIPRLFVINCIGGHSSMKFHLQSFIKHLVKLSKQNQPIPKGFQEPSVRCIENKTLYDIFHIYEEYIPCWVLDMSLRLHGKKEKFVSMQERIYNIQRDYIYFLTDSMFHEAENFKGLSQLLEPEDREMIYTDIKDVTFQQILDMAPQNSALFDAATDYLSPKKRRNVILVRTMILTAIRRVTLFLIIYIIYWIVSKLFF